MLSVIIPTDESERVLVPTLSALVAGAIAGIVREVIIADAGSRDETASIADVAGCRLITKQGALGERLLAAAGTARGPWLLFLHPGVVLDATWTEEVSRFIQQAERGGEEAAVFRLALPVRKRRSSLVQGFASLASAFRLLPQPAKGLLIAKRRYDEVGGHRATAAEPEVDLLRRLGRRIATLDGATMLAEG
jgi:glycosyltransferase involved in cell wall biosynthesis